MQRMAGFNPQYSLGTMQIGGFLIIERIAQHSQISFYVV